MGREAPRKPREEWVEHHPEHQSALREVSHAERAARAASRWGPDPVAHEELTRRARQELENANVQLRDVTERLARQYDELTGRAALLDASRTPRGSAESATGAARGVDGAASGVPERTTAQGGYSPGGLPSRGTPRRG